MRLVEPKTVLDESVILSGKRHWTINSSAVIVDPGLIILDMPLVVSGRCQYLEWRAAVSGAQLEIIGIEVVRLDGADLDQAGKLSKTRKIAQAKLGGWRTLVLRDFKAATISDCTFGESTDANNVHIGPGRRLHVRSCRFANHSHHDRTEGTERWIGGGPIIEGVNEVLWDSCNGDVDFRLPDVAKCDDFVALRSHIGTGVPNILTDVRRVSCIGCVWTKAPWGGGFLARGRAPSLVVVRDNLIDRPVIVLDNIGYPPVLDENVNDDTRLPAWIRSLIK